MRLNIVHLSLNNSLESFRWAIVNTSAYPRHGLDHTLCLQHQMILIHAFRKEGDASSSIGPDKGVPLISLSEDQGIP